MKIAMLSLLLTAGLFFGCSEKEELVVSEFAVPVITGYHLRDENGQALGNVGSPNTRWALDPIEFYNGSITAYPNPSRDHIAFGMWVRNTPQARVWIVPAVYEGDPVYPGFPGTTVAAANAQPVVEFAVDLFDNFGSALISTAHLSNGYYRVYLRAGDLLLWDNLVVSR